MTAKHEPRLDGYDDYQAHKPFLRFAEGDQLHFRVVEERGFLTKRKQQRKLYEVVILADCPTADGEVLPSGSSAALGVRACIAGLRPGDCALVQVGPKNAEGMWTAKVRRKVAPRAAE